MDNNMIFDMAVFSIGIVTAVTGLFLYWRETRRGN